MDWKKISVKHISDKSVSMTQKEIIMRQPLLPLLKMGKRSEVFHRKKKHNDNMKIQLVSLVIRKMQN